MGSYSNFRRRVSPTNARDFSEIRKLKGYPQEDLVHEVISEQGHIVGYAPYAAQAEMLRKHAETQFEKLREGEMMQLEPHEYGLMVKAFSANDRYTAIKYRQFVPHKAWEPLEEGSESTGDANRRYLHHRTDDGLLYSDYEFFRRHLAGVHECHKECYRETNKPRSCTPVCNENGLYCLDKKYEMAQRILVSELLSDFVQGRFHLLDNPSLNAYRVIPRDGHMYRFDLRLLEN